MNLKVYLLGLVFIGSWQLAGCSSSTEPAESKTVQAAEIIPAKSVVLPVKPLDTASVAGFIDKMVTEHGFERENLQQLFSRVAEREDIIAKITRPAERTKEWHEYRAIFMDQPRIEGGAEFWRTHQTALQQAQQKYGVPPEIITAIIGVETRYGRITGNDPVIEALATLAFAYPRRADFFRSELEHYLLLTREEQIDPLSLNGSYAGAMGLAQFMPSSYRAYAVDFDQDGQRDLWQNPVDAIGSVGNYLARHKWQPGGLIAMPAQVQTAINSDLLMTKPQQPKQSIAQWQALGVQPVQTIDPATKAVLMRLQGEFEPEYWLGFKNFYVITRYNHSRLYAMAVYQLAQAIRQAHQG